MRDFDIKINIICILDFSGYDFPCIERMRLLRTIVTKNKMKVDKKYCTLYFE